MRFFIALLIAVLMYPMSVLAASHSATGVTVIRYPVADNNKDTRSAYYIAMLRLALNETRDKYGPYRLLPVPRPPSQQRLLSMLANDKGVDVVWTMTSKQREESLRAIHVPLMKGLMGYRLLIIRETDRAKFAKLKSADELRQLTAGQLEGWPDVDILRANGFSVVTASHYDSLFVQLEFDRFDYFPRALNEPYEELEARPNLPLIVAPNIALYYPTAEYFFVNKGNRQLAKRLHTGLMKAIDDGRFDQLFYQFPANAEAMRRANLKKRRVFWLQNPMLAKDTPVLQPKFWFFQPLYKNYQQHYGGTLPATAK